MNNNPIPIHKQTLISPANLHLPLFQTSLPRKTQLFLSQKTSQNSHFYPFFSKKTSQNSHFYPFFSSQTLHKTMSNHHFFLNSSSLARKLLHHPFFPLTSSMSPSQSPSIISPKQPFSTNQNPFFPSNPTPPPPPYHSLSSLPTFPANISSLVTHPSHSPTPKLLKAITFPIVALSVLSLLLLLLLLFFRRKTRRNVAGEDDDSDRLFPPNSAASDGRKKGANSEFLYLGTLVSSRGEEGGCSAAPPPESSPELRPLPPLERRVRRSSEEEDFYSPSGSPEKFGSELKSVETKRLDFYVSSLSVASSSSSSLSVVSSSSPSSSPRFKLKLPNLAVFRPPPPPLSPPKIKLSSCSLKKVPDLLSVENVGEFGRNHFVVVPPPPPPLLAQQGSGFDAVERREEVVKPKLKPLHWDKVKASSDRAMVWDQMKSSSFQ